MNNDTVLCIVDAWKACSPWRGGTSSRWCIFTIIIFVLAFLSIVLGLLFWGWVLSRSRLTYLPGRTMSNAFARYCKTNKLTFGYILWPTFADAEGKLTPVSADNENIVLFDHKGGPSWSNGNETEKVYCPDGEWGFVRKLSSEREEPIYCTIKEDKWKLTDKCREARVPRTQLVEAITSISRLHGIAVAIGGAAAISTNLAIVFFGCSGKAWARLYTTYNVSVLIWTMPLTILYITAHLVKMHTILCAQGMTDVMANNRAKLTSNISRKLIFKSEDDRSKWVRLSASCSPGSFDPLWWMEPLKTSRSASNVYDTRLARRNYMYAKANTASDSLRQTCGGFLSIVVLSVTLMAWENWWSCDISLLDDVRGIRNTLASTMLVLWNVTVGLAAIAVFNLGKAGTLLEDELEDIVMQVTGTMIERKWWWWCFPFWNEFKEWIFSLHRKDPSAKRNLKM